MTRTKGTRRGGAGAENDPTATDYFDALPDGWASFPACTVRSQFVASLQERGVITRDALPARLHRILDVAATETDWLPEVVHVTAMLAVRDARFGHGPDADGAFLSWLTQLNRDLFSSPHFAAVLSANTPDELVARLPEIWTTFRRGTSLTVAEIKSGGGACVLSHPLALFAPLSLESHRRAVAILLVKAGAVQPTVKTRTEPLGDLARTHLTINWS